MTDKQIKFLEQAKNIIEQASGLKYSGPGIYQIFIDDNLVYIGQSKSMIDRIASHMWHIDNPEKTNKYIQLKRARDNGHNVRFDVLKHCDEQDLDLLEGQYIRQYLPPLNYQIPKEQGIGYTVNRRAKNITYEQILKEAK